MTFASRARAWLPVLPVLAMLGLAYWLNQQVLPEAETPDRGSRHDPDAIMENFTAVKFDERGAPRFIVAARKMQHYPDDDSTVLELPRLTSMSASHPAIHTVARRGVVSSRGDEVFLYEAVEMLREASAQREELALQTEYLRIVPDRDWADTDHAVRIFDSGNIVHAVGLEMDNRARTVKLLSQVKSEHAPRPK